MSRKETPVLLLTGYLGSGKTTLVNHILSNKKGIKFAVIVNDIGEVNIDADLIQKGGVVGKKDESLVALQNGCICCTLKMDLIEQLTDIMKMARFDYIVIEASGICEPEPIARTIAGIPQMGREYTQFGTPRLDCIVTVVDALRMKDEFACGESLKNENIDEEDIENLVIEQIEFCNIVILNKVSEVEPKELERIRQIVRNLAPDAQILECDYANVKLDQIIDTYMFDYNDVSGSAGWIKILEGRQDLQDLQDDEHHEHHHHSHDDDDDDDHEEHEHHHHHHHDEDEGEAEEYGIGTYVYFNRRPFDTLKFNDYVLNSWPKNIIRCKGLCYFADNQDMSYIFETAGKQKKLSEAGYWFATASEEELRQFAERDPSILKDWDEEYGDRMEKIVFIGQKLDKAAIKKALDDCLF
ncbi:MAG: GTP-binding protein [Bacteroidales bacterium]|nr:GTP-binding protein [Bacteroidales bacterium]